MKDIKKHNRFSFSFFKDEDGFTTLSVVVSLLLTLTLIFSSAQVYRVMSASADIQNVSDACAQSAQNQVAEFMILVRVCDSVVLSLSLASVVSIALGVICMCTPVTAVLSDVLIEASEKIINARDSFANKSSEFLNSTQKALPFISSVKAYELAKSNNGGVMDSNYLSIAILMPGQGVDIAPGNIDDVKGALNDVKDNSQSIKQAAALAEEAAKSANKSKLEAFMADCGNSPNYCMYERAKNKANMKGSDNPLYGSPDTWNFSIPLKRSQAYYPTRLAIEKPEGSSIDEQSNSALRKVFYKYASEQINSGYVIDSGDSFKANFPHMPKNTDEMKTTTLFTDSIFPISFDHKMHSFKDCPGCDNVIGCGSLSQFESEDFEECPYCKLCPSALGKVAAASSSIDNGYEFHYAIVEKAAADYQKAKEESQPLNKKVKDYANQIFDKLKRLIKGCVNKRIYAKPPGSFGVICITINSNSAAASSGFESSFVKSNERLGIRAAVSAATLIEENSDEGKNLINSICDGFSDSLPGLAGGAGIVLGAWSKLLTVYSSGQDGFTSALENALNQLPLFSASGLGTWAANSFANSMQNVGLEPANILALKPVLVNSAYVTDKEKNDCPSSVCGQASKSFAVEYLTLKNKAIDFSDSSNQIMNAISSPYGLASVLNLDNLIYQGGTLEVATIMPLGSLGPTIPIRIQLPECATGTMKGIVSWLSELLQDISNSFWDKKVWR